MPSRYVEIPTPVLTFLPEYSAGGSMTFTTVTTVLFEYFHSGQHISFNMEASGTIGGTPSSSVYFTLPVRFRSAILAQDSPGFSCSVIDNGTSVGGMAFKRANYGDQVEVQRYDGGSYSAGTLVIRVSGGYFVDTQSTFERNQLQEEIRALKREMEQLQARMGLRV